MGKRNEAREITQAVNRLGELVQQLTLTIGQFLEYQQALESRRRAFEPGLDPYLVEGWPFEGMREGDALELAIDAVREARNMLGYGSEYAASGRRVERLPPPGPEEVERWERLREERRRAEDY